MAKCSNCGCSWDDWEKNAEICLCCRRQHADPFYQTAALFIIIIGGLFFALFFSLFKELP